MSPRIAIIGGTGLGEALGALGSRETFHPETPFGPPSAPIVITEVDGVEVALLARHGLGHVHPPSRVPYRANLFALKMLGVEQVLASGAVGSLREEIAPRDLVVPDQVIDKTFRREGTFFDDLAVHVELAEPFCGRVRGLLLEAAAGGDTPVHPRGTYVCMEGPQFSTRAESLWHRSVGGDLIGMTAMPEARLAREAELCYALIALPTDYDCWQPPPPGEPAELLSHIIENVKVATQRGMALIRRALPRIAAAPRTCRCQSALTLGIWTDRSRIRPETFARLEPLLGRHRPPER